MGNTFNSSEDPLLLPPMSKRELRIFHPYPLDEGPPSGPQKPSPFSIPDQANKTFPLRRPDGLSDFPRIAVPEPFPERVGDSPSNDWPAPPSPMPGEDADDCILPAIRQNVFGSPHNPQIGTALALPPLKFYETVHLCPASGDD